MWIFRLFTELANNNKRDCFTIDSAFENKNGPGRYRTNAENPEKQVCYFGKIKDDKLYNVFISWHIKSEELKNKVYFKIEKLKTKGSSELFNVDKTLQNGAGRGRFDEAADQLQNDLETLWQTFPLEKESQLDPDFSTIDEDVHFKKIENVKKVEKKKSNYSTTKVKARNLLTNVSYRRFKDSDFENENFIGDLLSFIILYASPIGINRKLDTEDEKLIRFLWDCCLPAELSAFIYQPDIYKIVAHPLTPFQKINKEVKKWLISQSDYEKKSHFVFIRDNFINIHYIYSTLFPKMYNRLSNFGIIAKGKFDLNFQSYKVMLLMKKEFISQIKKAENYKKREAINENEQKPIKIKEPQLPTQKKKIVKPKETVEEKIKKRNELKRSLEEKLEINTQMLKATKKKRRTRRRKI